MLSRRRFEESVARGHRQKFAVDADRILHSRAYTRYIDKTQVFYLVEHEHISHRVLHVQLLSKIARTIGKFLRLNEDLLEAIALGHDIGHPPFGHDGEHILSRPLPGPTASAPFSTASRGCAFSTAWRKTAGGSISPCKCWTASCATMGRPTWSASLLSGTRPSPGLEEEIRGKTADPDFL